MTTQQILEKYLNFFKQKGHKQIPNVSLIPENDPSLLFVNSGMFPLVPYLSGEPHPLGNRLVNIQRSLRLKDIDEIGDKTHTLVFHMIGNWSLGDYFKKDQLPWAYEFFIEELKLDPQKMIATVFLGDADVEKDEESISLIQEIFKKYGIDAKMDERIFAYGKESNWWKRGDTVGELGGPDSEIFYYLGEGDPIGKNPVDNEKEFLEIGNSVFIQYKKTETGWEELAQKNVDFGGGLERIAMVVQNKKDIFETDNFWPIIEKIQEVTGKKYTGNEKHMRILADHIRGSAFLIMDGVEPSNKDQGYVLRRLIRRMIRAGKALGTERNLCVQLVPVVVETFSWLYPQLTEKQTTIENALKAEEEKFVKTLQEGSKQVEKFIAVAAGNSGPEPANVWAQRAFDLYQSLGYPYEIFIEDLKERKIPVDEVATNQQFEKLLNQHQSESRSGAEEKFTGGLADHSNEVIRYHTVTHLMQTALRKIFGDYICQARPASTGTNFDLGQIAQRLGAKGFDFEHPEKLTDEQIKQAEDYVNNLVDQKIPVNFVMMPKEEAIKAGVGYMKNESYPDTVKVYYVGNSLDTAISKELCGGPHVQNTSELSHIKIFKQENIGKGKRRVYLKFLA